MHDAESSSQQRFPGWDADFTRRMIDAARPVGKAWFRWEVHGLGSFPRTGGALAVSNHSGGIMTTDTLVFSTALTSRTTPGNSTSC